MPKVLRIINRFNLGGPTYNVAYLSAYLPSDYTTLLAGGDKEPGEDSSTFILDRMGIHPHIIPDLRREVSWAADRAAYKHIRQLIREFKPDIVHTHASKAGAVGRLAAFHENVPIVLHTFHGHVFHSYFGALKTLFYKTVERYLAKRSDAIIAISEIQKRELSAIHGICPAEKIKVVPLGFDLTKFKENKEEKRQRFRKKYKLAEDEVAVVLLGRIVPVKNHPMFLKVWKEIMHKTKKKVRAFLVGDGEFRAEVEGVAQSLEIPFVDYTQQEEVAPLTFTSWITDADYVLAGCDIVCLTSFNEGTPVSLIEAQASGKAIVTTNVGGIKDILSPQCGRLAEVDDVAGFAAHLLEIIENTELRRSMELAGWESVGKKFHYTRLVNDMHSLYEQLLGSKK